MKASSFPYRDASHVPRDRLLFREDLRFEDDDVERESPTAEEGADLAAHLEPAPVAGRAPLTGLLAR